MSFIRSISGLRATLSDGLIPSILSNYAAGFSSILGEGPIIIGNDGRPSGKWIEQIIIATLQACGREVVSIGMVPTPTVQLMTEHSNAVGGIAVTASHNPGQWNGLKFLNSSGVFLDLDENIKLWEAVDNQNFVFSKNIQFPEVIYDNNAIEKHISRILALNLFAKSDILDKIKKRRFKIVVDAVNASGSHAVVKLLEKFGCEIIKLYCGGTGIFPHTPEPIAENLTDLCSATYSQEADLGIAVDPDSDRLVLIGKDGNPIGEEKTIALATLAVLKFSHLFETDFQKSVVINLSTSRMSADISSKFNAQVFTSSVGEINVVKKMKEVGAIIGGEGSGGVILPACHYGRDSLVGIALVLSLLAESGSELISQSKELPQYEMIKMKKEFTGDISKIIQKFLIEFKEGTPINQDGLKINFSDSWIQIRSSNTEPIIRIIAEAKTKDEAEKLAKRGMDLI